MVGVFALAMLMDPAVDTTDPEADEHTKNHTRTR